MAKDTTTTAAAVTKTKRFHQRARFLGGDGATVTIFINESKKGGYNLGSTLREMGAKPQTGCTLAAPDLTTAQAEFDKLVAVAIAHGWVKKEKKVREPKPPAFTADTFPTAKPYVPGLAFPKKPVKKTGAKKTTAKK
jgi:hypothetical protein